MPEGYSLPCPNCGSLNTYFSAGSVYSQIENTWVCNGCGLTDAPVEDWRPNLDKDKEENNH